MPESYARVVYAFRINFINEFSRVDFEMHQHFQFRLKYVALIEAYFLATCKQNFLFYLSWEILKGKVSKLQRIRWLKMSTAKKKKKKKSTPPTALLPT